MLLYLRFKHQHVLLHVLSFASTYLTMVVSFHNNGHSFAISLLNLAYIADILIDILTDIAYIDAVFP